MQFGVVSNMGPFFNKQAADAQVQLQVCFQKSIIEDSSFWISGNDQPVCILCSASHNVSPLRIVQLRLSVMSNIS